MLEYCYLRREALCYKLCCHLCQTFQLVVCIATGELQWLVESRIHMLFLWSGAELIPLLREIVHKVNNVLSMEQFDAVRNLGVFCCQDSSSGKHMFIVTDGDSTVHDHTVGIAHPNSVSGWTIPLDNTCIHSQLSMIAKSFMKSTLGCPIHLSSNIWSDDIHSYKNVSHLFTNPAKCAQHN